MGFIVYFIKIHVLVSLQFLSFKCIKLKLVANSKEKEDLLSYSTFSKCKK